MLKGDLEWFSLGLHLEHSGSLTPCCLCQANCSTHPWTDHRPDAVWMETIWSSESWRAIDRARNPMFGVPGVSITVIAPDLLHTKHLGTDAYFLGSVLVMLTHHLLPGSRSENLEVIWSELEDAYRAQKTVYRFGNIKETMFWSSKELPKLKGRPGSVNNLNCLNE